jgi:histidinol phosphatase-like PHP family hydrolase
MHDFHFHTDLSSCAKRESSLKIMLRHLKEAGVTTAGVANHLWDAKVPGASGWYAPQNVQHVLSVTEEYAALTEEERCGIKLYFGCETEYVGQGRVALKADSAELFDYVLVPAHHFHMKNFVRPAELEDAAAVGRMMRARFTEVCNIEFAFGIAHPFMVLGYPGRIDEILATISDSDFGEVFTCAAEKGKSVELNICTLYQDTENDSDGFPVEYRRMFNIARECGCKFHLGSDAHAPERLGRERFDKALKFAEKCGMTFPEDPFKNS